MMEEIKMKKILALVITLSIFCSMFTIPLHAAAPEEKVEVLVSGEYSKISALDNKMEIYSFESDNGYGLYSLTNGWITECQWDSLYETSIPGFYFVRKNGCCGVLNSQGEEVVPVAWDSLYIDAGIVVVCDNGLWGIMDINGNILLEPSLDSIDTFSEGIAIFYKDSKCGFVNTSGRIISEAVWCNAQKFSDSFAAIKNDEGCWGYINTLGEIIIPCQYKNVNSFKNGYAPILEDETVYIIDKNNNRVIVDGKYIALEPKFDCLGNVESVEFFGSKSDIACVLLKGEEKYCYIDNNYMPLTDCVYKYDVEMKEQDYCITVIPNRYGIDKYAVITVDRTNEITIKNIINEKNYIKETNFQGNIFFEADSRLYNINGYDLFKMEFDEYIYHYDNSNIINATYNGQYACVTFDGQVISNLTDYQFYYVSENLYVATADDGRVKLCDKDGKQIVGTDEYAEAYYCDGYVYVKNQNNKWGLCDKNCNVIVEPQFDKLYEISEGMLKYKSKGKYGFVNIYTLDIIKPKYSNTASFSEGLCWVSEDVLIGAIDRYGKYVIKPLYWGYNDCTGFGGNEFSYGVTTLRKDKYGEYGVVNQKGQKILDFVYSYIGAFGANGVTTFEDYEDGTLVRGLMRVVHNDSEILPTKITTNKGDGIRIYVGCYDVITETVTPAEANDLEVTFASANESVATVDEVGRVYGVSEGNTVIVIMSKATTSVLAVVNVTVEDRALHTNDDIIPIEDWEGQTWLSDVVIERLNELGFTKKAEELTYGDLLKVTNIHITDMEDPGDETLYHIPNIIGEFSNLISFNFAPKTLKPLISTKPDSVKYLPNLYEWYVCNAYGDVVDEEFIRNNINGIPDINLFMALSNTSWYSNGNSTYCNYITKHSYNKNRLCHARISDLTGLSLLENFNGDLDLSCNNITDISELGKIDFTYGTIDLSNNNLDLNDENTLNVIKTLEGKGCTVKTDNQKQIATVFYEEYSTRRFFPTQFKINLGYETSNYYVMSIHNGDASDISIVSSDTTVADGYIKRRSDGNYNLVCKAASVGKAELYLMQKGTENILYKFSVSVSDPRFWSEDIVISYEVNSWDPTYARVRCENDDISFIQYRKQGEEEWENSSYWWYSVNIKENGIYEFRYCNEYGLYSNTETLEITGIKELLTDEQMPDENLRKHFNNGSVYQGFKVSDYLNISYMDISDIKGLSLLDFSECSRIVLSHNYISDISELAKLDINNTDIDLSYNKIDFTLTTNAEALRQLYKNGCTVNINNQFFADAYLNVNNIALHSTNSESSYGYYIDVYQSDVEGVTLGLRNGKVVKDFYYQIVNSGPYTTNPEIYMNFKYSDACGTDYVDFWYNGKIIKTISITVEGAAKVNVGYYSETSGYYCSFNNWAYLYEYRKQGDDEWNVLDSSWFYIKESGNYEFRIKKYEYSDYSDITTIELKQTEYLGLKMILNGDGWKVYDSMYNYYGSSRNYEGEMPENLLIPDTVDGYPIVDISGVECLQNLKSITISKNVKKIGNFYGCNNLETITVDEENPYYYSQNNLVISKSDMTLTACGQTIDTLEIPEGIKNVGSLPMAAISNVIIPTSFTDVEQLVAIGSNIKSITVAQGHPKYFTKDGILYEKYTGGLLWCSSEKEGSLIIDEDVLFIGGNAFSNSKLSSITLPSFLIVINDGAFSGCYALNSITLYDGVCKIGWGAFSSCYNLKDVYYRGSQENWDKLNIDYGNTNLTDATIHFVSSYQSGDINGDKKINGKDYAMLLQSINGWSVAIDKAAADVTGDGKINGKDYALLLQYINGWNVELK